jgi:hypothetical protein
LVALVRCLDLAQLARRDVGIEDVEPFIVGEGKLESTAGMRFQNGCFVHFSVFEERRVSQSNGDHWLNNIAASSFSAKNLRRLRPERK